MSQIKSELAEHFEYFNKYSNDLNSRFNISSASTQQQQQSLELYDLSEEFINLNEHFLINDSYDQNELLEEHEIKATINKLVSFCSNCLSKVTFEQLLGNKFFKSSHFILYSTIRCLFIRLQQSHDQNEIKQQLNDIFFCAENVIDYLNSLSNNKNLKLEVIDLFLLCILNSISNIFYYIRTNDNYEVNSDQTAIIKSDLIKKSTVILNKITVLIDVKLVDLLDVANYNNQISINKFCKHLIYIINNLKEARSVVSIWKMISKLVFKNKQFTIDTNIVSKSNQDKRFLINKIYLILDNEINSNLKSIKSSLYKIGNGENRDDLNNTSSAISSTNTQLTSTNNIIQDTSKLIKFTGFYFKIFNSLVTKHFNVLVIDHDEKFFALMTHTFSLLTSIIFLDIKTDIGLLIIDDETKETTEYEEKMNKVNKSKQQFHQVKNDFIKEFVLNPKNGNVETILSPFLLNIDYFNYLTKNDEYVNKLIKTIIENSSITTSTSASQFQTQHLIDSNVNKYYDYSIIEDYLLFYLIYLNKFDYSTLSSALDLKPLLDNLFNMLDICIVSINLPNYLANFEFLYTKNYELSSIAACLNNQESIEFYDFVLITSSYLMTRLLFANKSMNKDDFDDDLLVYLIDRLNFDREKYSLKKHELVEQFYKKHPSQIQFSRDLLILIFCSLKSSSSIQNLTYFLKFICDIIEIKTGYTSLTSDYDITQINNLSDLLVQVVDYHYSNNKFKPVLSNLEDYIKSNKLYYCFSLIANYLNSNCIDDFANNTFTTLNDLYKNLIEIISDFSRTSTKKNEQLLIKKTIAFIETKYFQQCLKVAINLFDSSSLTRLNLVKSQLGKNLMNFFKLNELSSLFKYFENINSGSKLNFDYYKMLHLFISDSIHLYSLIISSSTDNTNDNEIMSFFEFLNKNYYSSVKLGNSNSIDLIKKKSNSLLNNFKFQTLFVLKKLASKKIENKSLVDKITNLFIVLLNDSSNFVNFFAFECLNEFSIHNDKLLADFRKQSDSTLKNHVDSFLLGRPIFSENIDDFQMINERLITFIETKYNEPSEDINNDIDNAIEPMDHNNDNLNDTLNLIMSAMDTTISCSLKPNSSNNDENSNDNISYSPKIGDDEDDDNNSNELIEKMRQDSAKLIEIYESKSKPAFIKKEIQDFIKYLSEAL